MAERKHAKRPDDAEKQAHLKKRGERMREVRIACGFEKQVHVSLQTGAIDSGSLSRAESGDKDLYLSVAERLADAYGVSLDVLVGRIPFDPAADRFPARAGLLASPEFQAAPAPVRERVLQTQPVDEWSAARWARYFFSLCDTFDTLGALPPMPSEEHRIRPRK